jgi:hypothetical protein
MSTKSAITINSKINKSKSEKSKSIKFTTIKPKRDKGEYGTIYFSDYPSFKPNLTPKDIFQMGSFGGTYFRPIHSTVTNKNYKNKHLEYPSHWFATLDIAKMVTSNKCDPSINKYKVKAGSSLLDWENSGWIKSQDPYGWFQWYCHFYIGRRSPDDERQVNRWDNYAGEKRGRWRHNLIKKCKDKNARFNDYTISPVIRQGLQHWAYILK